MIFLTTNTPKDKRQFTVLYEKYRHLMQKTAEDILNDRFLAEDAVHNAFIHLSGHMDKIEEPESPRTKRYLITITKNTAIDIYRKINLQNHREVYLDDLRKKDVPMTYMETNMENGVLDILKNLPAKYRDIFLLKYSSCLENSEIADLCGIQEGTVRQRISRGKKIIGEALKKREEFNRKKKRD